MSKSTKVIAALGVAAGLGVAALPAATFAATTAVVNLKADIPDALSISATTTGAFAQDAGATGEFAGLEVAAGAYNDNAASTVLNVKSNKTGGWVVTVNGSGSGTNVASLYSGTDEIPALGSTKTTLANHAATSGWGLKLDTTAESYMSDSAFYTDGFAGVGTNSRVLYSTTAAGNNEGINNTVIYGIQVSDSQNVGTYTGQITYTVANNSN